MNDLENKIAQLLENNGINWRDNPKVIHGIHSLIEETGLDGLKSSYINPDRLNKSTKCPLCEKHIEFQKVTLSKRFCELLIKAYLVDKKGKKYFHTGDDIGVSNSDGGGFAKLKHWGFIASQPNPSNPSKILKGMWMITDRGKRFVEGRLALPKDIIIYNKTIKGSSENKIGILKILGESKYKSLMGI